MSVSLGASTVLPWWERFPHLFLREVRIAKRERFRPALRRNPVTGGEQLVMGGRVRVQAVRPGESKQWYAFDVEMTYPEDYPFNKLDVTPLDPKIRKRRHQASPSGVLCYMQEEMEPWVLGTGIERALEGARDWFVGDVTGVFVNEVAAGELLSYLPAEGTHVRGVLIPEHAMWNSAPDTSGRLVLEWNRWAKQPSLAIVGARRSIGKESDAATARAANTRLWRALRVHMNDVKTNRFQEMEGLWFRLSEEPLPFHNLEGLEDALMNQALVTSAAFHKLVEPLLSRSARALGWLPIMLEYTRTRRGDRDAGPEREWLFIALVWPKLPRLLAKKGHVSSGMLWQYLEVRGVPSYSTRPEDLGRRVGQAYQAESLTTSRVIVVGTGALGSTVARSLAAMGVGRIGLVDPDRMQPGNVVRHEGRFPDVGELKISALAQILHETNPDVEIDVLLGTREQHGNFEAMVLDPEKRPSLIIVTVANKGVDGQVDDVVRRGNPGIPVLHAWVMAQAQMLRAFVYRAGETACVYCNGIYERDARVNNNVSTYVVGPPVPDTPFFEANCSSPAFPGAGNANALAAQVIVEMALDALQHRLSDKESHWVFAGNRIADVFPELAIAPLSIIKRGFSPHAECPACNGEEFGGSLSAEEQDAYRREVDEARAAA